MINSKKGQSLSVNTIIIMILAVFVLIIVVVALTGGSGNFVDNINDIIRGSAIDAQKAVIACNSLCQSYSSTGSEKFSNDFCNKVYKIDNDGDKKVDVELTCREMTSVSCASIQCQ